ncbi:MAG: putative phosphate transport protein (TIGR00153 family) [Rhodothermales bacterium]|jgi:predicted phosphate transport protein (TIGR00153 family)
MGAVVSCVEHVVPLFEALEANNNEEVDRLKELIFQAEESADTIKHTLRQQLPRGLFLPVDRRDLVEVLDMQDSIADVAQDIAGLLVERRMSVPRALADGLLPYVRQCVEAVHLSSKIVQQLDELLETGFRGREATIVDDLISSLNALESETDLKGLALARALFDHEDDIKPVSVIFWYKLLELTGDLADYAEKVGNRLRLMIAR